MSNFEIVTCLMLAPIAVAAVVIIAGAAHQYRMKRHNQNAMAEAKAKFDAVVPATVATPTIDPARIDEAILSQAETISTVMQALQKAQGDIGQLIEIQKTHANAIGQIEAQFPLIADAIRQTNAHVEAAVESFGQRVADTRPYTTAPDNQPKTPSGKRAYGSVEEYLQTVPKRGKGATSQPINPPQGGQAVMIDGEESIEDEPEFEVDEIGRAIIPIARPEPAPPPVMPKRRGRKK